MCLLFSPLLTHGMLHLMLRLAGGRTLHPELPRRPGAQGGTAGFDDIFVGIVHRRNPSVFAGKRRISMKIGI